jgi:hypothetical protein
MRVILAIDSGAADVPLASVKEDRETVTYPSGEATLTSKQLIPTRTLTSSRTMPRLRMTFVAEGSVAGTTSWQDSSPGLVFLRVVGVAAARVARTKETRMLECMLEP